MSHVFLLKQVKMEPEQYFVEDDGLFPNSRLPLLFYPKILRLPKLFAAAKVKKLFQKNNWKNNWKQGVYTYHHYHSITHEVLGVCEGETLLLLGGEKGIALFIEKGDVLVIPAGVAHINLGKENDVTCVGGYPGGMDYDMNYGKAGEKSKAFRNIASVPLPKTDPVFGKQGGVPEIWK
jgi:uncharacterized protein YjlB